MQRNEPERRQPRPGDEEDESLEKPASAPSFLTARELQVKVPAKSQDREKPQPGQKRGDD
jgi:hypothetical protein